MSFIIYNEPLSTIPSGWELVTGKTKHWSVFQLSVPCQIAEQGRDACGRRAGDSSITTGQ